MSLEVESNTTSPRTLGRPASRACLSTASTTHTRRDSRASRNSLRARFIQTTLRSHLLVTGRHSRCTKREATDPFQPLQALGACQGVVTTYERPTDPLSRFGKEPKLAGTGARSSCHGECR